jgi:hypothetical protein
MYDPLQRYRTRREEMRERFGGTKIEGILFGEKTWWEVFCAKFLTGNQIFFIKTSNEIKIQYNYN